jgi:hypothetical protein
MNDTERLNWLEREPWRLAVCLVDGGYKFRMAIGKPASHSDQVLLSEEYETLREAIDEGMKQIL